ncbi:DUF6082 family protein [Nocardia nova]|uniref:DUF6082 family protein n=1 Tax=Nocardia nova TaxID=37330 RepID=UPI00371779F6
MSISSHRHGWLHRSIGWIRHRTSQRIAFAAIIFASVVAVLMSPLLLLLVPKASGIDWGRLREVSQTYGATSAIVSALALCGVAASLFIQTQQFKAGRFETVRRYHLDLNRIVLEEPEVYAPCFGKLVEPPGIEARQFYYTASWMRYGLMGYEAGVISEQSLRDDVVGALFRSEIGRDYWARTAPLWGEATMSRYNRRTQEFKRIVDDEFQRVVAAGPPAVTRTAIRASQQQTTTPSQEQSGSRERMNRLAPSHVAVLTLGTGIALGIAISRSTLRRASGLRISL